MIAYYLDSSVGLRILLGHSPAAAKWFDSVTASDEDTVFSSRLLRTEVTRALRRLGQPVDRRRAVLDYVGTVPLDHTILQEAESIGPHVKTLDAIHLASALHSGMDEVVVCSHDARMKEVAEHLGLGVHDPVTDDSLQA